MQKLVKIKSCFNSSSSVLVSRSMMKGLTLELIFYLWGFALAANDKALTFELNNFQLKPRRQLPPRFAGSGCHHSHHLNPKLPCHDTAATTGNRMKWMKWTMDLIAQKGRQSPWKGSRFNALKRKPNTMKENQIKIWFPTDGYKEWNQEVILPQ